MSYDNYQPLGGWAITLFSGADCQPGNLMYTQTTDNRGIVDFTGPTDNSAIGLEPGLYSVNESIGNGWQNVTPLCQNVDLTQSNAAGKSPQVFNQYPPAGNDTFDSGAQVEIDLGPLGSERLLLNGPTTVQRGDPYFPPTANHKTIDTEIVAMDLTGQSPTLGQIRLRESPTRASTGRVSQLTPGADFPASSFFDVFVEIDVPNIGTLHNEQPIRMNCSTFGLRSIPPLFDIFLMPPQMGPIQLYNSLGMPMGAITRVAHLPVPDREYVFIFVNRLIVTPQ